MKSGHRIQNLLTSYTIGEWLRNRLQRVCNKGKQSTWRKSGAVFLGLCFGARVILDFYKRFGGQHFW